MTMYAKPTEFLNAIGSHAIIDAAILEECDFDTSGVPRFTPLETAAKIEHRGLGGTVPEGNPAEVIYGYETAIGLAETFLGCNPGAIFEGRGAIFRACLNALAEAGR